MQTSQRAFIEAELFQLTLAAVTQRGQVYRTGLPEQTRAQLHQPLFDALMDLSQPYAFPVDDASHIAHLVSFAERVSARCGDLLKNGRFRIGSAQKALNLHLKYRWCLGWIPEPPHCPFDGVVLPRAPRLPFRQLGRPGFH